ncbi:MAG: TonB-dependent receptor [Melioribacteraceae bacterium]|jgi:hypothetical protein|nr:TonB-dependent receptor [Melioribacteraceae bacterium]
MKNFIKHIILLQIFTLSLFAQSNGIIAGNIVDKTTKQPLIGVNLIVVGTTIGAASDIDGNFRIENLSPGTYSLTASYIGYTESSKSDIVVSSARPKQVKFELAESTINIEGVTVTAGYYNQIITEPLSVTSFSNEEIRRTPGGFEDVVRALSVIPGVAKQSGGRNDLVVRGGAPSENLYLVDGFVVPNINHFATQGATGGTNSYIDLDFIDKSTFSTGGFSVKYGDKLSSVLGVDLREGRKDRIGGKALISASQFGFNIEGPITANDDFIFSVRRSYLDFLFNAFGFSFVPQYYDMLFKYNYRIDNSNKLSVLFVGVLDDINFNNNTMEDQVDNARILASSQKQYTLGVSYRHLMKKGFFNVRFGRNYIAYDSFQKDSLLNPIFLNNSKEATNDLTADLVLKVGKSSEINVGAGYSLIRSKNEILFTNDFETSFGDTLLLRYVNNDNYFHKANAFFLYNTTLFDRFVINAGLRGEYFNPLNTKFTVSPRASFKYVASSVVSLNFSAGIYRQSPSYIWLVYPGNDKLEPIRVEQYIFGADHLFTPSTRFKLELFYKNYNKYAASELRDYLVLANSGSGFGGAEDNYSSFGLEELSSSGTGFSRGIEISVQQKASDIQVYGIVSLTYSETRFKAIDNVDRVGQYNQNWILNLSGGYLLGSDWIFSAKFRFASGFPYTPIYQNGTQLVSEYLAEQLPVSHSLDVRVDKIWDFGGVTLITYIDIQNVYNRKNLNGYRWDYNENKVVGQEEFGILPSIGISIEF